MSGETPEHSISRLVATREAVIVVALGAAALWIIPRQTTSGPVLGLPPAFLPQVCAVAIIALALLSLTLRLWKAEALPPERVAAYGPAALMLHLRSARSQGAPSIPFFNG